jgi:uncharacterized protein (TIGR02246 family)
MKTTCLPSLCLCVLASAACTAQSVQPGAPLTAAAAASAPVVPGRSQRDQQLATLDAMRAADEAKDARALAALYAEDATVTRFGGRSLRGRAEIEDALRGMMAPAAAVRSGFGRVWLKGDVAIAEETFNATVPGGTPAPSIGTTMLEVMWFDAQGRIRQEHDYLNQSTLDAQARGELEQHPVPPIPLSTEVHVGVDSPADAKTIAWAKEYEAAASRSDEGALAGMDDHVSWRCVLGFSGESKDDMAHALAGWRTAFPDQRSDVENAWPIEDFIVVEYTFTATHKGKFAVFEPTNHPIVWHWAEVWQMKDGRIARGWSYTNFKEVRAQLGGKPLSAPASKPACSIDP